MKVGFLTAGRYCIAYENGYVVEGGLSRNSWDARFEFWVKDSDPMLWSGQAFDTGSSSPDVPNGQCFTFETDVDIWSAYGSNDATGLSPDGGPGIRICSLLEKLVTYYSIYHSTLLSEDEFGQTWSTPEWIGWSTTPESTPLNTWVRDGDTARYSIPWDLCFEPIDELTTAPEPPTSL